MHNLLVIYQIDKDQGSEAGSGYQLAKHIVEKLEEVTIISRVNNIDKLGKDPDFKNCHLIGVDVPRWLSWYKYKQRGIILYYYLWQVFVGMKIRALQKSTRYDVIHQINFHATWAPHFIVSKTARIVWGPLTHHADIPYELWDEGRLRFIGEIMRRLAKRFFWHLDVCLRAAIYRTDKILLGHAVTNSPFAGLSEKCTLVPQAASVFPIQSGKETSPIFSILFVGRFVSLKGVVMALEAAIQFTRLHPDKVIEINLIGQGPLTGKLQAMMRNAPDVAIHLIAWSPQEKLAEYYKEASVFLFPSLEGQGMVVAEAMAHGCPVICLENSGPQTVAAGAGMVVKGKKRQDMINDSIVELSTLADEYWNVPELYQLRVQASLMRAEELSWPRKVERIMRLYHE